MTLTAPGCPVAGEIARSVEAAIGSVNGTVGAKVDIVFEPPWSQSPDVGRGARRPRHVLRVRPVALRKGQSSYPALIRRPRDLS